LETFAILFFIVIFKSQCFPSLIFYCFMTGIPLKVIDFFSCPFYNSNMEAIEMHDNYKGSNEWILAAERERDEIARLSDLRE